MLEERVFYQYQGWKKGVECLVAVDEFRYIQHTVAGKGGVRSEEKKRQKYTGSFPQDLGGGGGVG